MKKCEIGVTDPSNGYLEMLSQYGITPPVQTIKGFTDDMIGRQFQCGEDVYIKVYDLNKVALVVCGEERFPSVIEHTISTHLLNYNRRQFTWKDDSQLKSYNIKTEE